MNWKCRRALALLATAVTWSAAAPTSAVGAAAAAPGDGFLTVDHGGPQDPVHAAASSAREPTGGDIEQVHYEICNRGLHPLVYRWPKPGFQNGIMRPLPPGRCAAYATSIAAPTAQEAPVNYGQRPLSMSARAYLAPASKSSVLRHAVRTLLYSRGIGNGPRPPQQTVADRRLMVEIAVVQRDGRVVKTVRWSSEVGALALRLAPISPAARAALVRQLQQKAGYSRHSALVDAEDLMRTLPDDQERGRVPGEWREGLYLRLVRDDGGVGELVLEEPGDGLPGASLPAVVQDPKGHLLWLLRYATTGAN